MRTDGDDVVHGGRREPDLWWTIGDDPREIYVRWRYATVSALVNFGDGTPTAVIGVNERKEHTYAAPGAYAVTIRQTGGAQTILAQAQVVIRATNPAVTIASDPNAPGTVIATAPAGLDDTGIIPVYRVHWNYQAEPTLYTDFWGLPSAKARHAMRAGDFRARVIDLGTKRWTEHDYSIPEREIDFTTTLVGTTATVNVTNSVEGKALLVSWGDLSVPTSVEGAVAEHTYPPTPRTYLIQLWHADASGSVTKPLTVQGAQQ